MQQDRWLIYPELVGGRVRGEAAPPPPFPEACPVCAAAADELSPAVARYACGGAYVKKPQAQTHTDKWWGECGGDPSPAVRDLLRQLESTL